MMNVNQRWLKIIWLTIMAVGFMGLSVHVYAILENYYQYQTVIYNYKRDGYYLPHVTFCNKKIISSSNLQEVARKYKYAKCRITRNSTSASFTRNECRSLNIPLLDARINVYMKRLSKTVDVSQQYILLIQITHIYKFQVVQRISLRILLKQKE